MKNFKNFGTRLEKEDQMKIFGGVIPPGDGGTVIVSGWELQNGSCYCDNHVTIPNGGYADYCHIPCNISNCQSLQ